MPLNLKLFSLFIISLMFINVVISALFFWLCLLLLFFTVFSVLLIIHISQPEKQFNFFNHLDFLKWGHPRLVINKKWKITEFSLNCMFSEIKINYLNNSVIHFSTTPDSMSQLKSRHNIYQSPSTVNLLNLM